jgi:hypothetical protein
MSTIQGNSPFEARLRDAFAGADLPMASAGLRDALERIPDGPIAVAGNGPGARRRSNGRGILGALGVAAVLLIGGAIALSGGGLSPLPPPSTVAPSVLPTVIVTYQLDWTVATPSTPADLSRQVDVVRNRLLTFGIHADVHAVGDDRIVVTLPGDSPVSWRSTIGQTGRVAFVPLGSQAAEKGDVIDDAKFPPLFANDGVAGAAVSTDQAGGRIVTITLAGPAKEAFSQYSATHIGSFFAITVDHVVVSAPTINSEIPGGEVAISQAGGWDRAEATSFVALLANGPLPVPMHEISVESGPPGPPVEPLDSAAPTPGIASIAPSALPTPSLASGDVDCESPPKVAGDRIECLPAVDLVMAMLPAAAPPVTKVTFRYACVDVMGRGTLYDCAIQAFGLVTVGFDQGDPFVVQLSLGDGPRIVAPLGGDGDARIPLAEAAPAETCTDPFSRTPYTIRMDAGASVPVWAEAATGQRVPVRVRGGLFGVASPFPMILDSRRHLVARDGTVVAVGDILRAGLGICTSASDGAVLISESS